MFTNSKHFIFNIIECNQCKYNVQYTKKQNIK